MVLVAVSVVLMALVAFVAVAALVLERVRLIEKALTTGSPFRATGPLVVPVPVAVAVAVAVPPTAW